MPDLDWLTPSPRVLRLWRGLWLATVAVVTIVVAAVLLGSGPVGAGGIGVALAVGVGVAALGWVLAGRRYRAWGYAEREADLLVRRGLLVRRLSVVPYGRMQFVDVTAGPLDRRLGLATVHLHTAAAATDATVPGLDEAEATRLRDRLAALGESRAAGL